MTERIAAAVAEVEERVASAARRSGRDRDDVLIVGVCKGVDPADIRRAVAAGVGDLGVNRAQELDALAGVIDGVKWHHIGAIQTNKVRLLEPVVCVHGLCREREARALDAFGERWDRTWEVLVQVNVAGEASKRGIDPSEVEELVASLETYKRVLPRGFMFVAPQAENAEDVRWVFAEGRRLRDRFEGLGLTELSMGMTEDYEVAIEEGATIVRIGRAIFRPAGQPGGHPGTQAKES